MSDNSIQEDAPPMLMRQEMTRNVTIQSDMLPTICQLMQDINGIIKTAIKEQSTTIEMVPVFLDQDATETTRSGRIYARLLKPQPPSDTQP